MTRTCETFILLYVSSNVCAKVKMGTVMVGYGIAVFGRLSFKINIFVSFDIVQLVLTFDQSSLIYLLQIVTRFRGIVDNRTPGRVLLTIISDS